MITWKVKNQNRLLTEVKKRCSAEFSVKDIRWSIEHNRCFVNQMVERFTSTQVGPGDTISIQLEKRPSLCKDEKRVIFEDEAILVYDKPPFISTEQLGQSLNCLLVHRLDRDTTGLLLLAKNEEAKRDLERQFRERLVQKEYLALVERDPGSEGTIRARMAPLSRREGSVKWGISSTGVEALTEWKRIAPFGKDALLLCTPYTGRTHQIRVHLAHIGHPLVGDVTYGSRQGNAKAFRPQLHAYCLKFTHPKNLQILSLKASPPSDFLAHRLL